MLKYLFAAFLVFNCLSVSHIASAQTVANVTMQNQWNAYWIAAPGDNGTDYGVFQFSKTISLPAKPASFVVHVSADNRYKLYVNDTLVSLGPARGDAYHWNYETVDLAPFLNSGDNKISALVWNEARYRPEAQISVRTGFILQGNTGKEDIINTNKTWKCMQDKGRHPIWGFFAASNGEMADMTAAVDGNDNNWQNASELDGGHPKGSSDGYGWMLVPSALPQMEMTYQRIPSLRKAEGITVPAGFPSSKTNLTIPAHTTVSLLLDQTFETNAYITLQFGKGKAAGISLRYAESLYKNTPQNSPDKGNRNEVEGKEFRGRKDSIISNGKENQTYTTLYWRSFRYIKLIIHTEDEALVLNDLYGTFTGYPFQQNALFSSGKKEINDILNIGWRTARDCAMETYWDCPYYEQLQYIGDTRIQAMISYYNSGDDRLARNALTLMDQSRLAEGITLSRYPTHSTQIISTFSLWYIGMLYDYWMYRSDSVFIKDKLAGARDILTFFSRYQKPDGSLANMPYWTFVDWASGKDWNMGASPKDAEGSSAVFDLQLLLAYQWMAKMETKIGMPAYADLYTAKGTQLQQTIQQNYWDDATKRYADTKEKQNFSQHANSLAILAGIVDSNELPKLCKTLLTDATLTQCTIYFKYYLHQALVKGGLGNDYQTWLDVWRTNMKLGLTTWAEEPNAETSRSDCHAWGASPNIEYYRTVLGIDSDAPGFTKVKIQPHLGDLTNVSGEMPHPSGKITVSYQLVKKKWTCKVHLPPGTTGSFVWKANTKALQPGDNLFAIDDK